MEIKVFDRASSHIYLEKQYKEKQAEFLYNSRAGRILLRFFVVSKTFSNIYAACQSGKKSVEKIQPFVEKHQIDMTDFRDVSYKSFSDFFERKIKPGKRPFSASKTDLIAVADSKLLAFPIDEHSKIAIKNSIYTVGELIGDNNASSTYEGGVCLVFRLTVDDYHRYCFFDSGRLAGSKTIKGCLHTVGPISSKRYKVYSENFRIASRLKTDNFGDSMYIEIGALLVGKIHNHECSNFDKGDEKGYFSLGGSTIVILLKKDVIKVDQDIREYAQQGIETRVKMGETIGEKLENVACHRDSGMEKT